MTPQEISRLRASFQKIGPSAEPATALFYARLFELDPGLRELFRGDLGEQGRQLLQMLVMAVNGMERLDALAPAARRLGLNQASHYVRESHYDAVGEALLGSLAKGLGADFTQEIRAVWGKTYWLLAETMKAGARDGAAKLNRAAA